MTKGMLKVTFCSFDHAESGAKFITLASAAIDPKNPVTRRRAQQAIDELIASGEPVYLEGSYAACLLAHKVAHQFYCNAEAEVTGQMEEDVFDSTDERGQDSSSASLDDMREKLEAITD